VAIRSPGVRENSHGSQVRPCAGRRLGQGGRLQEEARRVFQPPLEDAQQGEVVNGAGIVGRAGGRGRDLGGGRGKGQGVGRLGSGVERARGGAADAEAALDRPPRPLGRGEAVPCRRRGSRKRWVR